MPGLSVCLQFSLHPLVLSLRPLVPMPLLLPLCVYVCRHVPLLLPLCVYVCRPVPLLLPLCAYVCRHVPLLLPLCAYVCRHVPLLLPLCVYVCRHVPLLLPLCVYVCRHVHLRREVGFWTVIMAPTVIAPYSTVKIKVGQNHSVRPYKTVPPYSMILTVIWPFSSNFEPK